ncbi:hypothetical protein Tco_0576585 [Tanacetum coccineum]
MELVISYETVKDTWTDLVHRFVHEDNPVSRRYPEYKKILITAPSTTPISTTFFSNNIVLDFQENSDDEVDERTSEEYLRDLDIEFHERAVLAESKRFIKRRNNFSEEVFDDEEMVQVKLLMALADDELVVGKNHARSGINQLIKTSSKKDVNENAFIHASMGYDHEMNLKFKDWVERHNPDSKLPNFNTGRILVPKNQAVTERSFSKLRGHVIDLLRTLSKRHGLGNVKHTNPNTQDASSKSVSGPVNIYNTEPVTASVPTEV